MKSAPSADDQTRQHGGDMRRAIARVDLRGPGRKQAVTRHRKENARLPVLKDQEHGGERHDRAGRDNGAGGLKTGQLQRLRQRIRRLELLVRHEPGRHDADDHIDQRADRQAAQDPDRHVPLRVFRFLGRCRYRVEADVREEHNRRALMDAAPPVRRERHVVARVDVRNADRDEQPEDQQLDDHHDVVRADALFHADVEQPRDQHHDHERGNVQQERHAGDLRAPSGEGRESRDRS